MQIEILLDPTDANFSAMQQDLQAELGALQTHSVTVSTKRLPAPAGTLVVDEVFRFLIAYQEEIKAATSALKGGAAALVFLKALIEVLHAVVRRREPAKKEPKKLKKPEKLVAMLCVGDRKLNLPAPSVKQKAFLRAVEESTTPSTKTAKNGGNKSRRR